MAKRGVRSIEQEACPRIGAPAYGYCCTKNVCPFAMSVRGRSPKRSCLATSGTQTSKSRREPGAACPPLLVPYAVIKSKGRVRASQSSDRRAQCGRQRMYAGGSGAGSGDRKEYAHACGITCECGRSQRGLSHCIRLYKFGFSGNAVISSPYVDASSESAGRPHLQQHTMKVQ